MNKITKLLFLAAFLVQSLVFAGPLHDAAREGNLDRVKALLASREDVNAGDAKGITALMLAAGKGFIDIVRELLNAPSANVNAKETKGITALMFAASNGHTAIVQELLKARADFRSIAGEKTTALVLAALKNDQDVIRTIREWSIENQITVYNTQDIKILDGIDPGSYKRDYNTMKPEGPLQKAARLGDLDRVTALIKSGVTIDDTAGYRDWIGYIRNMTALQLAAEAGHLDVVKELLRAKANINKIRNDRKTALHLASEKGQLNVIKELLNAGIDITIKNLLGQTAVEETYQEMSKSGQQSRRDLLKKIILGIREWSIEHQKLITDITDQQRLDGNDPGSYLRDFKVATIEKATGVPTKGPGRLILEYLGEQ